jgi:hypothetical protein
VVFAVTLHHVVFPLAGISVAIGIQHLTLSVFQVYVPKTSFRLNQKKILIDITVDVQELTLIRFFAVQNEALISNFFYFRKKFQICWVWTEVERPKNYLSKFS